MLGNDHRELERFAREHRVHYDVQPEFVESGGERRTAEFDVRLFASHPGVLLGAPNCEKCAELAGELASFARQVVADADIADRAEVTLAAPVLYESLEERDTDEVALTLRVLCASPEHRAERDGDDACTRQLRERLAAVGVRRS